MEHKLKMGKLKFWSYEITKETRSRLWSNLSSPIPKIPLIIQRSHPN